MAEGNAEGGEQAAGSASVFVSYSHRNRDLKLRVEAALRAAGYETRSDEDIVEGTDYRSDIARLIRSSTLTVVLWTHEAFSTRWVADEAHLADELANRDGRLRYIGVIVDPVLDRLPFPLTNRQNLNLSQDGLTAEGMQRLVAVVARFAALQGMAPPAPPPAPAEPLPETVDEAARELEFYTDATQAGTIPALRSYLTYYPNGAHRADAEARLAALTSPVHRWRKRMIGGGAAIAGALTLLFTGYPVLKELTTSPNAVMERAAEEAPELAAAIAPEPEAPKTASAAEPPPAPNPAASAEPTAAPEPPEPVAAEVGPVTPPPMLALATLAAPVPETEVIAPTPGTPVTPAALSTLVPPATKADPLVTSDTKSFDLNLAPLIEACDLAAGSSGYAQELMALGRPVVAFADITPETALPACAAAYAAAPETPRIRHQYGRSLHAGGETQPALRAEAAEIYGENCRTAGKAGAPSCTNLGGLYESGWEGTPADLAEAATQYEKACDLDYALGCSAAADLLRRDGPQKDLGRAAGLAEKGCGLEGSDGRAQSCNRLGDMYFMAEIGGGSDFALALDNFVQACDLDYALGCSNAALVLRRDGPQKDLGRAAKLAEKGCGLEGSDGRAESCNRLGLMREMGEIGGKVDLPGAAADYMQACDLDYALGCWNAANRYRNDLKEYDLAKDAAESACKLAPQDGSARGCNILGLMYEAGEIDGKEDLDAAMEAFGDACDGDYAWGCKNRADILREKGDQQSLSVAQGLLQRGCDMVGSNGRAEACRGLGTMFEEGGGAFGGTDLVKARAAYGTACELDDAWACNYFGYRVWQDASTRVEILEAAVPYAKACRLDRETCPLAAEFFGSYLYEFGLSGLTSETVAGIFLNALKENDYWSVEVLSSEKMPKEVIMALQSLLITEGHDIGSPDGRVGPKTKAAIAAICDCAG